MAPGQSPPGEQEVSQLLMICRYNRGRNHPDCANETKAAGVEYVKSVKECMDTLLKHRPDEKGVVRPPEGSK